jgi:hypothetical protein
MILVGHLARTEEKRNEYRVLVGEERGHLEDLGVDARTI